MLITSDLHLTSRICATRDKDEGYRGREEESATLQPAVTLMTPFITMCRLTS